MPSPITIADAFSQGPRRRREHDVSPAFQLAGPGRQRRVALLVAQGRNVGGDEDVAVPFHRTQGAGFSGDGRRLRNFVAEAVPHDHADPHPLLSIGPDRAVLGDDFESRRGRG